MKRLFLLLSLCPLLVFGQRQMEVRHNVPLDSIRLSDPATSLNYSHSMLFRTLDGRWMMSVHSHREDPRGRYIRTPHLFPVDLSGDKLRVITEE